MRTAVERFDERARQRFGAYGRTRVRDDELLRHPIFTRFVHWTVAAFFVLALLSGFAIYTPWLFHGLTPLFGGGAMTRLLHPWFGLAFTLAFAVQVLNWFDQMVWTPADRQWVARLREYVGNADKLEPEYVGFFNGGQKLYFWIIVASTIVFLVTGLPMWFPKTFGRLTVAVGYVLHDVAALLMLGGFIIHIYEGTAAVRGTFQAMTRGTVKKQWAWTHHPAWYRLETGRDPRADYEEARGQTAGQPREDERSR
jgi:formate dehydrogenase subunit gamma